jgi:uncharacterized membrane protein
MRRDEMVQDPVCGMTVEAPLDIFKKRYSRDEISKEEFEQMKKVISS